MPDDTTMNVNLSSRDAALREVQRQIEEGLESARRGELLDGEAVMQEVRERSSALRARGARDL
jgi:predicted transcriptional regulator